MASAGAVTASKSCCHPSCRNLPAPSCWLWLRLRRAARPNQARRWCQAVGLRPTNFTGVAAGVEAELAGQACALPPLRTFDRFVAFDALKQASCNPLPRQLHALPTQAPSVLLSPCCLISERPLRLPGTWRGSELRKEVQGASLGSRDVPGNSAARWGCWAGAAATCAQS